ncbi:MAG: hypothetical protein ACLRFM_03015 [Alphaproteobacteria bacterium]
MIKDKKYPIDYRYGSLDCPNIEQRIGKTLNHNAWAMADDFGLDGLYESDIQWIENNITKNSQNNIRDIFWKQDSYTHETHKNKYILDYKATFFEQFIDVPGIPLNVKRLLIYTVGNMRAYYYMKVEIEPYQHFFIERWMEKCR